MFYWSHKLTPVQCERGRYKDVWPEGRNHWEPSESLASTTAESREGGGEWALLILLEPLEHLCLTWINKCFSVLKLFWAVFWPIVTKRFLTSTTANSYWALSAIQWAKSFSMTVPWDRTIFLIFFSQMKNGSLRDVTWFGKKPCNW